MILSVYYITNSCIHAPTTILAHWLETTQRLLDSQKPILDFGQSSYNQCHIPFKNSVLQVFLCKLETPDSIYLFGKLYSQSFPKTEGTYEVQW